MLVSPCVLKHVTCRLITWWLTPVKGNYNWTNSTLITDVNYNPLTILGGEPPSTQPLNTSKPNRPPPSMLTRFAASSQRVISGFPDSRSCTIRCQCDNPWVQASDIWREFFNQDTAMFGIFGWVYFEKHVFFLTKNCHVMCLPSIWRSYFASWLSPQRTAKSFKSRWPVIYIRPYYITYIKSSEKMHISGACLQHLATHSHMFLPLEFDPSGCVARPDARTLNEIWLGCKLSCWSHLPWILGLESFNAHLHTTLVGQKEAQLPTFLGWSLVNGHRASPPGFNGHLTGKVMTTHGIGGFQILTHTEYEESIEPRGPTALTKDFNHPSCNFKAPVTIPLQSWGSFEMRHLSWVAQQSDGPAQAHLLTCSNGKTTKHAQIKPVNRWETGIYSSRCWYVLLICWLVVYGRPSKLNFK